MYYGTNLLTGTVVNMVQVRFDALSAHFPLSFLLTFPSRIARVPSLSATLGSLAARVAGRADYHGAATGLIASRNRRDARGAPAAEKVRRGFPWR